MNTNHPHTRTDVLKACATFRKVLMANIDPFLPLEAKVEAKAKINAMDYNELRAAVIALNNQKWSTPT